MTYRMGDRASAGKLIYNVTEAEWKAALGEGAAARAPEHRFLIVRATITNSGPETAHMPLLSLYNAEGTQFRELDSGDQVSGWLGLLREVKPTQTLQGAMVFDVTPASYKLQITDGGDPEQEVIAYVDIPLQLEPDPVLSEPPAIKTVK